MPKNQLNKDEMICHVLKLKHEVDGESKSVWQKEKDLGTQVSKSSTGSDSRVSILGS